MARRSWQSLSAKGWSLDAQYIDQLGNTVIYYTVWDGETREDPASTVERWVAVFDGEAEHDFDTLMENSNHRYFEGLKGAVVNAEFGTLQEADREATLALQDADALKADPDDRYPNRKGLQYEQFWEAVEQYGKDPQDAEAWKVIQTWRARQLRDEDREMFINA